MLYWEMLKKEWTENKWVVFWFWISIAAVIVMYIALFPMFSDDIEALEPFLEAMPPGMLEVFGADDITQAMTFEGFISLEMLSLIWPAIFAAMLFALGRKLVAKEVEDKTGEVLFTLPARRFNVFAAKFVAFYIFALMVIAATLAVIFIGGRIIGEDLNIQGFSLFFILNMALGFFLLSFTGLCSSLMRSGAKVAGIAGGFFVASYALHVMAILNETVERVYWLSFFKHYGKPREILAAAELDWISVLVLLGSGAVMFALSLYRVSTRDV